MKHKRWKILLVVVLGMGALTWLLWPSDWLTSELLSQIKIGMSTHEVIQMLGTPTSQRYSSSIGHKIYKVEVDGIQVPHHNEFFEPKNAWHPRIVINKPALMPVFEWQAGKLLFWADRTRILLIKIDDNNNICSKTVASITTEGGGLKDWLNQQWQGNSASKTAPVVMVTRAVSDNKKSTPTKKKPEIAVPHNGNYEFVPGEYGPVMHYFWGIHCSGYINQDGAFQPDLHDLEAALEAKRTGVPRVGSWPGDLVQTRSVNEKVYEYQKGILIPMIVDKDRGLIPEVGGKIIEFKDYEYSPGARRIYNLPGRFVPKRSGHDKAADIKYEYVEDLTIAYYLVIDSAPTAGYLNGEGKFIASDVVKGPAQQLTGGPLEEPLYEYQAGKLIPGKFKTKKESASSSDPLTERNFCPDPEGKVIGMSEYLRDYIPRTSPRIYNLPGRIVDREEKK